MSLLEIKNLHVAVDGKEILKGLSLTIDAGVNFASLAEHIAAKNEK